MTDYTTAGRGLKTMFIGEIVCLFSFIPFVGLIGLIVTLVGLNTASKAHPGYKTAFTIAIVNIVVSLLCVFLGPLSILVSILSVVMVYMICTTSAELLCEKGDAEQAARAQTVWKIYTGCLVVSIVCTILALIPFINVLAAAVIVVTVIVQLVGGILYLVFLYKASDSLQR